MGQQELSSEPKSAGNREPEDPVQEDHSSPANENNRNVPEESLTIDEKDPAVEEKHKEKVDPVTKIQELSPTTALNGVQKNVPIASVQKGTPVVTNGGEAFVDHAEESPQNKSSPEEEPQKEPEEDDELTAASPLPLQSTPNVLGRVTEPGAVRIHPRGYHHREEEEDEDDTEPEDSYLMDAAERGESINNNTIATMDETVTAQVNETGEELIQAELVPEESMISANAEILKDEDTPEYQNKKRRIRFCFGIIVVLAIVVIVIVVSVVNNQGSTSSGNNADSNSLAGKGGGTSFPTLSPTTAMPTQTPTTSPTDQPSWQPSSAPTRLEWDLVNTNFALDGISKTTTQSGLPAGGGMFGRLVDLADISNTPIGKQYNKTLLMAIYFGDNQGILTNIGSLDIQEEMRFYLCEEDPVLSCELGTTAASGIYGAGAISGNGAFLVMDTPDNKIEYFDLQTFDLQSENRMNPPTSTLLSIGSGGSLALAMNHEGNLVVSMTSTELSIYVVNQQQGPSNMDLGGGGPLGEPMLPPLTVMIWGLPQHPPFLPQEIMRSMDMDPYQGAVVVGTNLGIGLDVNGFCAGGCPAEPYNGYILRIFDSEIQSIGNQIEVGQNHSLFSDEGLALAANGTILAVGSATYPYQAFAPDNFQRPAYRVDVYRLKNDVWSPLGSPLFGTSDGDFFGQSVSFNEIGTVLAVSAKKDSSNGQGAGRVVTFQLEEDEQGEADWVQLGSDMLGTPDSSFGSSMALLPSGDQILVGAPGSDLNGEDSGEAFLYRLSGV